MRTVVIDTNVLLSHPDVVHEFPDAEVVIPDTVLSEIDKLKTARVDPELRYKGRQISRTLFELSERGNLHEGVELPGGGSLRVVALSNETNLPDGLSTRNADDRILAVAIQVCGEGCEGVTLVTNDLNMLLKGQSYGIGVERIDIDDSFSRRFLVRPFQRYRVPLTILAISLAVFAAIIYLTVFNPFSGTKGSSGLSAVPGEFLDQLSVEQQQVLNYLYRLQTNPKDIETQRALAVLYDGMSEQNVNYVPYAIKHWEQVVQLAPTDEDARTDLATLYFRAGRLDQAVQEVTQVLRQDPNHINANFNLGVFYLNSKPKDFQKAANQFMKVIKLTTGKAAQAEPMQRAQLMLEQVKKDAAAAGQPIKTDGGTL
ncbi:MAG: PIN domain-containing protein [Coriobacteriia bacterium]|nr:PIN domain-containing protein [Coriobacteriia bacterium]